MINSNENENGDEKNITWDINRPRRIYRHRQIRASIDTDTRSIK